MIANGNSKAIKTNLIVEESFVLRTFLTSLVGTVKVAETASKYRKRKKYFKKKIFFIVIKY